MGNTGDNLLDGGAGADTMAGGAGNDIYAVDSAADLVLENPGEGTDLVQSSISYALGAELENLLLAGSAGINGTGNALDNVILGNAGNNVIEGAAGNDVLNGALGVDTVSYAGALAAVTVSLGQSAAQNTGAAGIDTLASFENLTGSGFNDRLFGNARANVLSGGLGEDVLNGGAGADTLVGGAGNDTYVVDNLGDVAVETAAQGIDTVQSAIDWTLGAQLENLTLTGGVRATGNALANTLTGNALDNIIDGRAGADRMYGKAGDDTYYVNNAADFVGENALEGSDQVISSVAYRLSANVENLTLAGTAGISGKGNTDANVIHGNAGNNLLDGAAGADTMAGGLGNDTYVVDDALDVVIENPGEGTDLLQSLVSYALSAEVENLLLAGSGNINGTGNALNNTIKGNAGNNVLDGGAGSDALIGGLGDDTFVFDAADKVLGGAGFDSLRIDGAGVSLDLTKVANWVHTDIEAIDLTGSGNNTLRLALNDVLAISSTTDTLRIDGNAGDTVVLSSAWARGAVQDLGGHSYYAYTEGTATATLLIGVDITEHVDPLLST
jgi:Ca2+-binding RTX toxin-like protein